MGSTLSVWQLIFMLLFFCGAVAAVFFAKRSQNNGLFYAAICQLGIILIIAFPIAWLILCSIALTIGACLLLYGHAAKAPGKMIMGIVILLVGTITFGVLRHNLTSVDEVKEKQIRYENIQFEKLGKFSAEKYSAKNVAVLMPPDPSERQSEQIKAFEENYGAPVKHVEGMFFDFQAFYDKLRSSKRLSSGEIQKKLESEIRAYFGKSELAGVDVVLMMVGLPKDRAEFQTLFKVLKQKNVKLLIPNAHAVPAVRWFAPYVERGQIDAIVLLNVNSDIRNVIPENMEEAFNARYVLVTSENIDTVKADPNYKAMLVDRDVDGEEE